MSNAEPHTESVRRTSLKRYVFVVPVVLVVLIAGWLVFTEVSADTSAAEACEALAEEAIEVSERGERRARIESFSDLEVVVDNRSAPTPQSGETGLLICHGDVATDFVSAGTTISAIRLIDSEDETTIRYVLDAVRNPANVEFESTAKGQARRASIAVKAAFAESGSYPPTIRGARRIATRNSLPAPGYKIFAYEAFGGDDLADFDLCVIHQDTTAWARYDSTEGTIADSGTESAGCSLETVWRSSRPES